MAGDARVERLRLAGGRAVAVHHVADGAGERTVVLCHAAPGAGGFDPDPEQTAARGVTLLAVDRPGYGGSAPIEADAWASVEGAADDLAEVLDRRGTGPAGVAGWSAGGRVALALAARRPDLVDRVVVVATPAPDEEVPWIPPPQRAMLAALRARPPAAAHAELAEQFAQLVPADPAAPEALLLLGANPAEVEAVAGTAAHRRLAEMLAAAFAQGAVGLAADVAGYCLRPWGFQPSEVQARTLLLYGAQDPAIGPPHGRWWQRRLPDARLEVSPGEGHLLVIPRWGRALSHLAPRRRR
jgi:pimeloyl-ACP methyl ester carboxylesterase